MMQNHRRAVRRTGFSARRRNTSYRNTKRSAPDVSRFISAAVKPEQNRYVSKYTFADLGLHTKAVRSVERRGYTSPTHIQEKVIPAVLAQRDVVGIANTGTGKTASFALPLIHAILSGERGRALVVAPTRELAVQIEREIGALSRGLEVRTAVCIGGAPIGGQIRALKASPHIIIGTPGRLIDLLRRGSISLAEMYAVVLDEADRMLDMGFIADIRTLLAAARNRRTTLCFSATMPSSIRDIVATFMNNPIHIDVKTNDTSLNVQQDIVRVAGKDKVAVLEEYLKQEDFRKVIVFGRTKRGVEKLSRLLARRGVRAESIHGDKSHGQRRRSLGAFATGRVNVLVATDVAARGLDIRNVTHVINYDMPDTYDEYVHRIGRTGRGDRVGAALTFVE